MHDITVQEHQGNLDSAPADVDMVDKNLENPPPAKFPPPAMTTDDGEKQQEEEQQPTVTATTAHTEGGQSEGLDPGLPPKVTDALKANQEEEQQHNADDGVVAMDDDHMPPV